MPVGHKCFWLSPPPPVFAYHALPMQHLFALHSAASASCCKPGGPGYNRGSAGSQAGGAVAVLAGTYDPKKVLGVTKLDVVRAKAFIGQITDTDPKEVSIPVVGGHAGTTILPLLSQVGLIV